jgi:transposase
LPAPRKYPDELRERAVRLYRESEPRPTFRRLGEQMKVHAEALQNWVRQAVGGSRSRLRALTCDFRRRVRTR